MYHCVQQSYSYITPCDTCHWRYKHAHNSTYIYNDTCTIVYNSPTQCIGRILPFCYVWHMVQLSLSPGHHVVHDQQLLTPGPQCDQLSHPSTRKCNDIHDTTNDIHDPGKYYCSNITRLHTCSSTSVAMVRNIS